MPQFRELAAMNTWVGRVCGGHSMNKQVLVRVLQFSFVSAITPMLHQLSNWQHNYIKHNSTNYCLIILTHLKKIKLAQEDFNCMQRLISSEVYVVSVTGHITSNILKNHNAFTFSVQNSNNCLNLTNPIEIAGTYPT
jgi:hypothetical protein